MFRTLRFSHRCCCKVKHCWVLRCVERIKLDHEDESKKVFRKVGNYWLSDTTSRPSRLESLSVHNFFIKICRHESLQTWPSNSNTSNCSDECKKWVPSAVINLCAVCLQWLLRERLWNIFRRCPRSCMRELSKAVIIEVRKFTFDLEDRIIGYFKYTRRNLS